MKNKERHDLIQGIAVFCFLAVFCIAPFFGVYVFLAGVMISLALVVWNLERSIKKENKK